MNAGSVVEKEQKPVVIEHETKIYTEACYFAMKFGRR